MYPLSKPMFKNTHRRLHTALIGLILIVSLVSVASFPATVQAKGGGGLIGAIVGAVVGVAVVVATGGVGAAILYGTAAGVVSALDYRSCTVNIVWSSNCPGGGGGTAAPAAGGTCVGPANACGQAYQGTEKTVRVARTVKRVCSAPKTAPPLPAGYGTSCTSAANTCGQTGAGTIQCNGTCSATAPSDASCPVWTNYCTGGTDPNGNNWQIWAYSNQTPTGYKYVGPGTAANGCVAPVITPVTPGSCTFSGPLSWGAGCTANVNAAAPNSGVITITNTASGYTGSEQYACTSGAWVGPQNSSCSPFTPVNNIVQSPNPTQTSQPASNQPPAQVCTANAGAACPSSPNFCGQTTTGTYSCSGSCSATTPSDSLCPPPTVSISASLLRVQSGKSSIISWSSTYAKSCTVTKNGTPWQSGLSSTGTLDPKITTQSVYEVSCTGPGGSSSANVTVNVVPTYQEF